MESDMKTEISEDKALDLSIKELKKIGVSGFNSTIAKSVWNGEKENTLHISFINTFGVSQKNLFESVKTLKTALNQECILIKHNIVSSRFIE